MVIMIHTYTLKELYQSQTQEQRQSIIIERKKFVFKNCVPFTDCISEISNTQVDNAKDIDVVIPVHNLIEQT